MAHGIELKEEVFEMLKEHCLKILDNNEVKTVDEIMMELMDYPEIPMHYPYHHFIMPASLLTAAALEKEIPKEELSEMLDTAIVRSKDILGGFCGNYGACGAGVGAGMFLSIYTDTSPLSGTSWQWANELTGICLQSIGKIPGPRCCKRTAFLSIEASIPYINEKLDMHLKISEDLYCKYSEYNNECKKEVCPYYKK